MNTPSLRFLAFAASLFLIPAATSIAAPKIGVLLKGKTPFWTAMENGVLSAGTLLGADVIVKAPPTETDVAAQIELLDSLGKQGISALLIAPTSEELAAPVAALKAKGIKIVVLDSPFVEDVGHTFVGTDHLAAGRAAGRLLAGLVGDKDEVCIVRHNQTSIATGLRELGAIQALHVAHPQVVSHSEIYSSTATNSEPDRCTQVLSTYPKARAILTSGTPGTMAMLHALRDAGQHGHDIKLVGFGYNLNPEVSHAINDGFIDVWVAQLPGTIGYKGIEAALNLLKGKSVPTVIRTDFTIVTKDNLITPGVQALVLQ